MDKLTAFERKIQGFEYSEVAGGAKFKNGDTLLAKITPCLENGKTALVDILDDDEVAFGSTEFIVLRNNKKSTSDYVYYLARSPAFRKKAISCMEGTSGRKRVNEKALQLQELPIPNVLTQKNIAAILSILDAKIDLNNRINTELEAMAKTLYDYWFVQFDFPDGNGKPYKFSGGKMVWNELLKREVPKGWKSGTISDLGIISGGSTPSMAVAAYFDETGIPWITPKDLSANAGNKFIARGETNVSQLGIKKTSLTVMPRGTVLLSSRAPIGYMAIARQDLSTNQGFKSIIPNGKYSSAFIYYAIKNLIPVIVNNASGSTFKEISGSVLKSITTCLPSYQIMEKYTSVIEASFKKQESIEIENQSLAALRDWLLPMLMNGQVQVR